MANRKHPTAVSRMKQDYMRLKRDPLPYITAEPLPSNLLEWHYVVKGPEDSPYQGGYYHGTLLFPREFPFKPPSIYMLTPNGRFKTNTRLCLSISDFHPDTWNPTWSVGTILTGLLSFMLETTPTLGSTESTLYEKQQYAKKSLAFNLKNQNFRDLFPEICDEINKRLKSQHQLLLQAIASSISPGTAQKSTTQVDGKSNNNNNNHQAFKGASAVEAIDVAMRTMDNRENSALNPVGNPYSNWQSLYSNLIIVMSFAIFALIVNYVLKNLN